MAYPTGDKERVEYWARQIDHAGARLKPYFQAADVLIKQYDNEASTDREEDFGYDREESHTQRVKANLVFGWIDQSISNLLERHPHFTAMPLKKESSDGGPVVSSVLNYWYRETDQKQQDERILLDAFLAPYGVKKLGWKTDLDKLIYEVVEEPEFLFGDDIESELEALLSGMQTAVVDDQNHELHIEIKTKLLQTPEPLDPLVERNIEANIKAHQKMDERADPDPSSNVQYGAPFGLRWRPDHFFMDPLAQEGLADAQWVAFKIVRRIDDVRANPAYSNTEDLESSTRPEDAPPQTTGGEEDDFGLVTLYEIWARDFPTGSGRENILFVFAEGHDKILREDPWPYTSVDDFPVEILSFQTGVKEWYNKPGLVMAGADNVQALSNEILDSYLYIIRKMKNLILYDPESVDEDTIDNILLAPDMSTHPVRGMANSPGSGIQALDLGRIPNDKGQMLNTIHSLFDRAAGTPQPVSKGIDTATESSIVERRTTAREARRGNLLADFQVRVAKKFWQLTVQYRPERLFLIHEQADQWVAVSDAVAAGEYRFQIDISSQAQSIALERKQWNDLLNLMSGLSGLFQQLYGPEAVPNLQRIARELLVRGFNVQNPEEFLPGLLQKEQPQDVETQAAIQAMLQGSPGQAPSEGPSVTGPPRETESQERTGPALARTFREPAPNGAGIQGNSQTA